MFNPFRKTVSSVVASLNRAVAALDDIAAREQATFDAAAVEVDRQLAIQEAAADEQARAMRVRSRIAALID